MSKENAVLGIVENGMFVSTLEGRTRGLCKVGEESGFDISGEFIDLTSLEGHTLLVDYNRDNGDTLWHANIIESNEGKIIKEMDQKLFGL